MFAKKFRNKLITAGAILVLGLVAVIPTSVHAGSGSQTKTSKSGTAWYGDNTNLRCTWEKSWAVNGDKMKGKMEGYGNHKRVTARVGSVYSVTSWASPKTFSVGVTDVGGWGASYSVKFEWK